MSEIKKFLLEHWVLSIIGSIILYNIFRAVSNNIKARRLGCKPLPDRTSGLLGIRFFFLFFRLRREGTLLEFVKNRFNEYEIDTFSFRLLGLPLITTRDPENVKAMLATQFNDFPLGGRHEHFFPLLGDGIFTLDGSGWKHSRAMLRPQFSREQVAHTESLEPHIQMLAKQVRHLARPGESLDLQNLLFKFTIDTATQFLFGESCESLKDGLPDEYIETFDGKAGFAEAFNSAQQSLLTRSLLKELYFLYDSRTFRRNCAQVHKFADHYVNMALNMSPEELEKQSHGYTFLYELVKETRDPRVLRDQSLNILLAGRDTTAGVLTYTFCELADKPEIFEKLKQEVYACFGGPEYREPVDVSKITFEQLKKCEYLKAVLNEALRMYPSVPQNFRCAAKDTTLPRGGGPDGQGKVFVPKGQMVAYQVGAMHRDPKYYGKDFDVFRPERWLTGETRKLGWAYLPFNGGPRICLGQQFALTEAGYVIVRLLQIFPKMTNYNTVYPPKESLHLTSSSLLGCMVGLEETE